MTLNDLVLQLGSLVGWAALLAVLINVGKWIGFVKDGTAGLWSTGGNIIGLIVLFVLKVWKPDFDIGGLDGAAAVVAQLLNIVLSLLIQLGVSFGSNKMVKSLGIPVVSKSFSE